MAEIIRTSSDELRDLVASCKKAAEELNAAISHVEEITLEMSVLWEGAEASITRKHIKESIMSAMKLYELLNRTALQLDNMAGQYDAAEQEFYSSFFK